MKTAPLPPPTHATGIQVSTSVIEIMVLLGQTILTLDSETNAPMPKSTTEWFQVISFNPVVAKQLALSLAQAVQYYEQMYGKIPEDPDFSLNPLPAKQRE